MSLITRCPACGTMFKVVIDQLKVSQGWVRCGHCAEVFDGSFHLQAANTPVAVESTSHLVHENLSGSSSEPTSVESEAAVLPVEGLHSAPVDAVGADSVDVRAEDIDSALPSEPQNESSGVSFVRDAQRQAFWRKPLVRIALVLFSLLMAALLMLQILHHQKELIVALEPSLKPSVQKLCEYLHCKIGPLRRIEAIVIDSTTFNKINADSYRLSFSLKNLGTTPVAMPSLEVTLTDTQDQTIVRRVFTPTQFGTADMVLNTGSDFSGSMVMQILGSGVLGAGGAVNATPASGPPSVAGYRVLAFYP